MRCSVLALLLLTRWIVSYWETLRHKIFFKGAMMPTLSRNLSGRLLKVMRLVVLNWVKFRLKHQKTILKMHPVLDGYKNIATIRTRTKCLKTYRLEQNQSTDTAIKYPDHNRIRLCCVNLSRRSGTRQKQGAIKKDQGRTKIRHSSHLRRAANQPSFPKSVYCDLLWIVIL